jgi:hypothetical protein
MPSQRQTYELFKQHLKPGEHIAVLSKAIGGEVTVLGKGDMVLVKDLYGKEATVEKVLADGTRGCCIVCVPIERLHFVTSRDFQL